MADLIPVVLALGAFCFGICLWFVASAIRDGKTRGDFSEVFAQTDLSVIMTDDQGRVISTNDKALTCNKLMAGQTLVQVFDTALPYAQVTVSQMLEQAKTRGAAHQDIVAPSGMTRVRVMTNVGGRFLWFIDHFQTPAQAQGATLSSVPMARLDQKGAISDVNAAYLATFGPPPKSPRAMGNGDALLLNQVQPLQTIEARKSFLVFDHRPEQGQPELYFFPTSDAAPQGVTHDWDIFEQLPVPLAKVTVAGDITHINVMGRKILGPDVKIGMGMGDFFVASGKSVAEWLTDAVQSRRSQKSEFLQIKGKEDGAILKATLNLMS
ncbi:MAG: hypothetical protein ACPGRD_11635, partial [Planktomarina sp.]